MQMIILIPFLIWMYVVSALRRARLYFFQFVTGSVGLFFFLMLIVQPVVLLPLTQAVAATAGILGNYFDLYDVYYQYGLLFIPKGTTAVTLYIDYECSGIIEIMAFCSMLWFFPLYNFMEKLTLSIVGTAVIFIANVLRIFLICVLIYFYGNDIYYFAHTIFGRIIFYGISIALYFYVFTRPQIYRQKVGKVTYGDNTNENP